jgi:anti-sigma B factor antagonist
MDIKIKHDGDISILYLEGKININSAVLIEVTGQLASEGCTKMLCDLRQIEQVDNNGLSILAITYKNIVNKGSIMKFCNVPPAVKELFKMVRLDLVFDIYDDEGKAVAAFEAVSKIDRLYLRRRFKRLEFYHPVKFTLSKKKQAKKMNGKILNISGEGVFVYTKNLLPLMSKVLMEIKLDDDKTYEIEGTVIWLADNELQSHCYPGMGIQFMNLSTELQKELIDFIDKNITYRSDL